ncbi:MAG TPA: Asp-tRNA(Asn)/Glu-tRNA(Gln) amidotransferase subunit GatB [Longimicrobiales bacterium]|nr:Asp-tRNA(Asn)/Glu-tRNA(Gln) amidotransferase subunit GatB [Longimicrobiales bacterium]
MTRGPGLAIGLEIHVQLATRTKLFCGDRVEFGAAPNTRVCPVCLGLPGALPVLNEAAVRLAVRAALGLGCVVHETSQFARKNYFYPDLPKGYQITQLDRPLATAGSVALAAGTEAGGGRSVRIRRLHLEEDAGKSVHDRFPGRSAVDLNRAGVPLIEIVTEPDLTSPSDARLFLIGLKRTLEYLEVSDCDMEKGSLRVDANLSVRSAGNASPGEPTELKNLNSFANLERALRFEAERQQKVVEAGGAVRRETLLWDVDADAARPIRSKTAALDYRYFPEPDLPPVRVDPALIEAARAALPEPPHLRARRFRHAYGLTPDHAEVLTATRRLADYFEAAAAAAADPSAAANWVMTEVLAWLNRSAVELADYPVPPARLGELLRMVGDGTISTTMGRHVLARMTETGQRAAHIVEEEGLTQVSDDDRIAAWIAEALAAHPEEAARLRAGEAKLRGFFVGRVMKRSDGTADPRRTEEILRRGID